MGDVYVNPGGGGGVGSDDTTAVKSDVMKGKTFVGKDTGDEVGTGTLELTGNADEGKVLAGATFYSTDPKVKRTGNIPNCGSAKAANDIGLNANGLFYHIAKGYYHEGDRLPWVYAPLESIRNVFGLIASKIANGVTLAGVTGTYKGLGNAGTGDVRAGKSFSTGSLSGATGTLAERGNVSASLNCGASYTIASGIHGGGGRVTANSLASQTGATASAGHILSGWTCWVNGNKITGTLGVQSILSFSAAAYSSAAINFTWRNPAKGAYSGVIIVGKVGSYPSSITDGTRYYKGHGNNTSVNGTSSATVSGFAGGTTYYFRAFSYAVKSGAEWIHSTTRTATAATTRGQQTFTASGNWTVPVGVREVEVFCVGGGGGGSRGENPNWIGAPYFGNGGGGGGFTVTRKVNVTPGQVIPITVGAGGRGATKHAVNASSGRGWPGGASLFGNLARADGGEEGGVQGIIRRGGSGGGGRSGEIRPDGGSNGSNGFGRDAGTGQGATTREFGAAAGTLYAGGGGGGGSPDEAGGRGGAGGGGNKNVPGAANTGGGGGGGNAQYSVPSGSTAENASDGGSGIVIFRWGY